jgi:3-deoxy-D-manno-octulosonic-acid transferase
MEPGIESIWFHSVSLGEVISSSDLVRKLSKDHKVILTTTTGTGFKKANQLFFDNKRVDIAYAPWDFYFFTLLFLNKVQPKAAIFFETEIWPNSIHLCKAMEIPSIVCNGRLSKKSFKKYMKLNIFFKKVFSNLDLVMAQGDKDKNYYHQLGCKNIHVTGSVKFDQGFDLSKFESLSFKKFLEHPYFLAASTHEGEDKIILDSFNLIKKDFPSVRLVVVPRHPERANKIKALFLKMGSKSIYENEKEISADILIVKSLGILPALYADAQLAFVGGSLVNRGGHNIIEPAIAQCPFILGENYFNFKNIVESFISAKATHIVKTPLDIFELFCKTYKNQNDFREGMIRNANTVVEKNIGATMRQLSLIRASY